ncbi:hypothetical protein YB2330_001618 [Saitoella coloradoensis]
MAALGINIAEPAPHMLPQALSNTGSRLSHATLEAYARRAPTRVDSGASFLSGPYTGSEPDIDKAETDISAIVAERTPRYTLFARFRNRPVPRGLQSASLPILPHFGTERNEVAPRVEFQANYRLSFNVDREWAQIMSLPGQAEPLFANQFTASPVSTTNNTEPPSPEVLSRAPSPLATESVTAEELKKAEDEASVNRTRRRCVLEELILTEWGYVRDLRYLVNVYFASLGHTTVVISRHKQALERNTREILAMHERVLSALTEHFPELKGQVVALQPPSREILETGEGAHMIAKILSDTSLNFLVYEPYCTYQEKAQKLLDRYERLPNFDEWEASSCAILESLVESVDSETKAKKTSCPKGRRAMTFRDLMAKPYQRIMRYPMLLADVAKHMTPEDSEAGYCAINEAMMKLRGVIEYLETKKKEKDEAKNEGLVRKLSRRVSLKLSLTSKFIPGHSRSMSLG